MHFRGFNTIIYDPVTDQVGLIFHSETEVFTLPGYRFQIPLSHEDTITQELSNLIASLGLEVTVNVEFPMTLRDMFMGIPEIWACYVTILTRDHGIAWHLAANGQQFMWQPVRDSLFLLTGALNHLPPDLQRGRSFYFLETYHWMGPDL